MKKGKRGADHPILTVRGFLLLMVLFFVLYIVIVSPTSEKEKLIQEGGLESLGKLNQGFGMQQGQPQGSYGSVFNKQLLIESPGLVVPFSNAIESKPIDSVRLFMKEETSTRTLSNDLIAEGSIFKKKPAEISFRIDDPFNIGKVDLYFVPVKTEGKLKVSINGRTIYNREVRTTELPIEIPIDLLKTRNNIVFEAEGNSMFGSNEQHLKSVQLVMKGFIANNLEQRSFVLTKEDKDSLKRATLFFMTSCLTVSQNGKLNIYLNDRLISTRSVVCDIIPTVLDLDKLFMVEGRNILTFEIDRGEFVLERMILEKDFDEVDFKTYYFPLQVTEYDALVRGFANGILEMSFNDDGLRKKATLFVNGERVYLDSYGARWGIDVSPFLVDGENFIKIIPDNQFEILHMEVSLR
jgi:hypothetical protein